MKKILYLIPLILFLLSCSNNSKNRPISTKNDSIKHIRFEPETIHLKSSDITRVENDKILDNDTLPQHSVLTDYYDYQSEVDMYNANINKNSLTNDSNNLLLSEFIVDNEVFEYILDTLTEEYNKCEIVEKGYHFTVFINDAKIKDYSGMKFLSVSRSFYKGFVSRYKGSVSMEYGFFYYKDYLFILEGQQLKDIFKKTDRTQKFSYKDEPVVIFDPPRWLYYYWNKDFYFGDSAPCGG